ncbi:MAG: SecDF P1 head subdomain-containing protein [Planctomycetota bacterium]|jgi:hypothetical protein
MTEKFRKLFPLILIALAALLLASLASLKKANQNLRALRSELASSIQDAESVELALHDEKQASDTLRTRLRVIFEKLAENPENKTLENIEFLMAMEGGELDDGAEAELVRIVRKRLETLGKHVSRVEVVETGKLVVRLSLLNKSQVGPVLQIIEAKGDVKLRFAASEIEMAAYVEDTEGYAWLDYFDGRTGRELIKLDDEWNFGGEILSAVYPAADGAIGFDVKPELQKDFFRCTQSNSDEELGRGRRMAIILDDKILSAPTLRAGISNRGIITPGAGGFKPGERRRIIALLGSGPLPVRLEFSDMKFVETVRNARKEGTSSGEEEKLRAALIRVIRAFREPKSDPMSGLFHPKLVEAMSEKQEKWHEKSVFATSEFYRDFPADWEAKLKATYRVIPPERYILSREVQRVLGEPRDLFEVRFDPMGTKVKFKYHTHVFVLFESEFRLVYPLTPDDVIDDLAGGIPEGRAERNPFLKKMTESKKEMEGIPWKDLP